MQNEEQKKDDSKLNEPRAVYKPGNLRAFKSFEDALSHEIDESLAQSPAERIRETVQLILRVYGVTQEELRTRKRSNKITIVKAG